MNCEEWKQVRLGDVCTLYYGKALTAINRLSGEIPVYSSAGITGLHNEPLVNSEGIIIGRKGTVGTVYYSPIPFYCIDTAYYVLPDKKYDLKYLYYRLNSLGLKKMNEDSAVPGLNRDTAYSQTFYFPPINEQKTIAATLSCLDDKIELNSRINKTLEGMVQAIFKSWFVDFEPFQDGEFVDSELGLIPKGWEIGSFTHIVKINGGGTPKTNVSDYWNGHIPFFTPKDNLQSFYTIDTQKHVTKDGLAACNSQLYDQNTVFVTARGTVGKIDSRVSQWL